MGRELPESPSIFAAHEIIESSGLQLAHLLRPGHVRMRLILVPRERLELSRGVASADFESAASTDSATQASEPHYTV